MKTLYININGEAIQSDENIEVIGSAEDFIIDSFYISLGMAIADGVTGIKYKPLVADFAKAKPEEFKSFTKQWNEIKAQLLGDNPSGDFEFVLTPEYLEWLKMNGTFFTIYNKKYQGQRQVVIKLSLDELYEDTVDAIRRKVIRFLGTNDNYKNFDEFVVNDEAVTRRSLIVRSIKSKYEDIAFVLYEKWLDERNICPKCGKYPCECNNINSYSDNVLFAKTKYDYVVGISNSQTIKYEENGEEHFTSGNELIQFYTKDGELIDSSKFVPLDLGNSTSFKYLAVNINDLILYKIDVYGIIPICDYSNGLINGRYNGELSQFNYNPESIIKATRLGKYLKIDSAKETTYFEDFGNKIEKITDPHYSQNNSNKKQDVNFFIRKDSIGRADLVSSMNATLLFEKLVPLGKNKYYSCLESGLFFISTYKRETYNRSYIIDSNGNIIVELEQNEFLIGKCEENRIVLCKKKKDETKARMRILDNSGCLISVYEHVSYNNRSSIQDYEYGKAVCNIHDSWGYVNLDGVYHKLLDETGIFKSAKMFSENILLLCMTDEVDYHSTENCCLYDIKNKKFRHYPNLVSGQFFCLSSNYYTVRYWNEEQKNYYNRLYNIDGTFIHEYKGDDLFVIE